MAWYKVKVKDTFVENAEWTLEIEAPDNFMARKEALYRLRRELHIEEPAKLLFIFRLPHVSMLTNYLNGIDVKIVSCRKIGE